MTDTGRDLILAVDLGKTGCRVRLLAAADVAEAKAGAGAEAHTAAAVPSLAEASGAGSPGLAAYDGVAAAATAILTQTAELDPALLARVTAVGVGAAGAHAASEAAAVLADLLAERLDAPAAIITDGLSAHLGAFAGGPGVVQIVGTGAVAFGVTAAGDIRRADGWGPWLGDAGSGQWVGRHGFVAALAALDGRGPHTTLAEAVLALTDSAEAAPGWIDAEGTPARRLASFAPTVLDHAAAGDRAASDIVDGAVAYLVTTARAAGGDTLPIAVVGGLFHHPLLHERLSQALSAAGADVRPAMFDAVVGAALIAADRTLPHERHVIRDRDSR